MPDLPSRLDAPHARPDGYTVVANAGAGSTEVAAVSAAVARLAADAPTELVWTDEPHQCVDVVRGIVDGGRLVVAGGDGSIHLALGTVTDLGRTHLPVGIIPLGTGNDFARNHDLPLDPIAAADVVIGGSVAEVDAIALEVPDAGGERRTIMVANNVHLGLGVRAAETASRWKRALKKFAYPVATAYEGVKDDTVDLTVSIDGDQAFDGPLLAALVLLGPSMGGGIEMIPDRPHALDVVLVEPADAGERASLVAAALRSRVFDADRAHHHRAATVTIAGSGELHVNADGEMLHLRSPIVLTLRPSAWKIHAPRRA